jgi:hypothetical protein
VNWKFWDKKEDANEDVIESGVVPISTLFRWALFDLGIKSPNSYADSAGFNPISEEGAEVEERDSVNRILSLAAYKDFITTMATINAEIGASSHYTTLVDSGFLPDDINLDEVKERITDLYYSLSASAIVSALSAALSLGIVVNPGAYVLEDTSHEQF